MDLPTSLKPPTKTNLLGLGISRTTYSQCADLILESARQGRSCTVAPTPVHGVICAYLDPQGHGRRLRQFTLVTPDGQPVRWALNLLRQPGEAQLTDRVYGPTLMLLLCQRAAAENLPIFLYGSTEPVLQDLQTNLKQRFPQLVIAGVISPPFQALTPEQDAAQVETMRQSGARLVFIGLGCPRQEAWAFEHRTQLDCPLVCVGAAFDFHAGHLRQAPVWMQRAGLEWGFRLWQEPRRLWQRYLLFNPLYLVLVALQLLGWLPTRPADD